MSDDVIKEREGWWVRKSKHACTEGTRVREKEDDLFGGAKYTVTLAWSG